MKHKILLVIIITCILAYGFGIVYGLMYVGDYNMPVDVNLTENKIREGISFEIYSYEAKQDAFEKQEHLQREVLLTEIYGW